MTNKTATEARLMADMKDAMKARDKVALGAIRMVRSKLGEKRTAKGAVELDDDAVIAVIKSYVKSLHGAIDDFKKGGSGDDDPAIADLRAEIAVLQPYLPTLLDEAATAALVDAVIAEHELVGPKAVGRAMGLLMKQHKGKVDAGLVKRLLAQRLASS